MLKPIFRCHRMIQNEAGKASVSAIRLCLCSPSFLSSKGLPPASCSSPRVTAKECSDCLGICTLWHFPEKHRVALIVLISGSTHYHSTLFVFYPGLSFHDQKRERQQERPPLGALSFLPPSASCRLVSFDFLTGHEQVFSVRSGSGYAAPGHPFAHLLILSWKTRTRQGVPLGMQATDTETEVGLRHEILSSQYLRGWGRRITMNSRSA